MLMSRQFQTMSRYQKAIRETCGAKLTSVCINRKLFDVALLKSIMGLYKTDNIIHNKIFEFHLVICIF